MSHREVDRNGTRLPSWLRWGSEVAVTLAAIVDAASGSGQLNGLEVGVSVVAILAMPLRHRWPLVAFALVLPGLYFAESGIAAIVVLYAVAAAGRRSWVVAACVVFVFAGFQPISSITPLSRDTLITVVYGVLFAVGPAALGMLVTARRALRAQMHELRRAHDNEQHQRVQEALELERAALAREMHDVVSNHVSLIAVQAGALQVASPDAAAREIARTIRQLSASTLDELRTMLGVLRSSTATGRPDLGAPRTAATADDFAALVSASGITATTRLDLPLETPPAVRRALYRGLQESLTNVRKHAAPGPVDISVDTLEDAVVLVVRNAVAAHGAQPAGPLPSGQYGLLGLAERAELLGGFCTSGLTESGDFEVRIVLPRVRT